MRKKKPENLTIPGMKARSFPNKAKEVDMGAWKDSPLYKAAARADVEKAQGALFEKPERSRCDRKCPGCGVTFSPSVESCPVEVFDGYRLGIDIGYDEYDILQRRREKDRGLCPGKGTIGAA